MGRCLSCFPQRGSVFVCFCFWWGPEPSSWRHYKHLVPLTSPLVLKKNCLIAPLTSHGLHFCLAFYCKVWSFRKFLTTANTKWFPQALPFLPGIRAHCYGYCQWSAGQLTFKRNKQPWFAAFADFHVVNSPSKANVKFQMVSQLSHNIPEYLIICPLWSIKLALAHRQALSSIMCL